MPSPLLSVRRELNAKERLVFSLLSFLIPLRSEERL